MKQTTINLKRTFIIMVMVAMLLFTIGSAAAFYGVDFTEPAVLPFDATRGTYNSTFAENLGGGLNFTGIGGIVYNSTGGPGGDGEYICNSGDYLTSSYFRTISADATEVSVFAWTKSAPTAFGMIVTHYDTTNLRSWSLESVSGGAVKVLLSSAGTGVTKSYTTSDAGDDIDDSTWHHVGFTYDNNTLIIYIDGVNVSVTKSTDTAMTTIYNPSGWGVGICARGNTGSWLGQPEMRITDVLIANRTLTADEVEWIYNNSLVEYVPQTDYYFSNDGDDTTGDGSVGNPYATITKLNTISLNPGDNVYFARGSTWRSTTDAYMTFDNGNSTNYITYTAYGSGNKPKFLGSFDIVNTGTWSNGGSGNIWNHSGTYTTEIGNLIFNGEDSISTRSMTYAGLNVQGEYYYDYTADKISLYSASNPATYYSAIEAARFTTILGLSDRQYVNIENLDVRYGGTLGFDIISSNYLNIRNNDVSFIGGSRISSTNAVRYGNCIQTWIDSNHLKIYNNTVDECYDAGLTSQSNNAAGQKNIYNTNFSHNIVTNSNYCWEYFSTYNTSDTQNLTVEHNSFIDCGKGLLSAQNTNTAYCMMGNTNPPTTTTQYWRNNICYNTTVTGTSATTDYFISTGRGSTTAWKGSFPVVDYNLYYYSPGTNDFQWNGSLYTNLAAFVAGTGQDSHSVESDPLFVDYAGGDYTPTSGSPACTMSSTGSYVGALPCGSCVVSLTNTSWSSYLLSDCMINDTRNYTRSLVEYDQNNCAGDWSLNTTFYDNGTFTCDYCSPSLVNSSWSAYILSPCSPDDSRNYTRSLLQYDNNTCYSITSLPSDLVANVTFWDNGTSYCAYSSGGGANPPSTGDDDGSGGIITPENDGVSIIHKNVIRPLVTTLLVVFVIVALVLIIVSVKG